MNFLNDAILILGLINFFRLSILTLLTFIYDGFITRNDIKKNIQTKINSKGNKTSYKYSPLLSVVIAAYNEEVVIQRTLKNLFQSTYKNFEVIIVNDGSKDKTEEKVFEFIKQNPDKKITYVYQTNQGKAHALNNACINYVKGKIVMCLDADSVVRKEAIENAVNYFRNKNIKALATNVKILPGSSLMGLISQLEYLMGYHLKKALTVGNIEYIIGGVGSMFRYSTLKKVGFYDTDTITEDIDLTMKVVKLGNISNLIVYAEDVVVYTESPLTLNALFRQRFRWKFGRFQTFWKNRELFFNKDKKYTKLLTFLYLPFQLFSEITFLFDPVFIIYIAFLSVASQDPASYFGMFIFLMFYTVFAIATDNESNDKEKILFLLIAPFSYLIFFIVSIVEYVGLIKCIIKVDEIINADKYNRCGWTPVARLGKE